MDKNALQQLSTWLQPQIHPVNSANTYSMPVQSQVGPVIPAADYDLRPAVYVDHGNA